MISRHGPFTVYKICIRETLEKVIEAESIEKAEEMYDRLQVEIYPEDFKCVEFIEMEEE